MKTHINNMDMDFMKITSSAYTDMVNYIASRPAESGGAGFGYETDNVIRCFVADIHASATASSYTINAPFLNREIKTKWEKEGMSLIAIIHAHPHGHSHLSKQDKDYFVDLLRDMPREKFYTPIVFTIPDGGLEVFPYVYEKGALAPKAVELEIVSDGYKGTKDVQLPVNPKKEEPSNLVLVFQTDKEKPSPRFNSLKEILIVLISVAFFLGVVFSISLYVILPFIFNSFIKIIEIWN
jgi:proteasome lid subunit RPN8/RPN11